VIRRIYECAALLGFCDREGQCAQVDPVVLDPAVGRILPRQIAQTRNPLLAPEVEHELVRMRRLGGLPLGVPVRGRLQVEHVVGPAVITLHLLAVSIDHSPGVARQVLAVGADQVKLGTGGEGVAGLRVERFEAEVSAANGPGRRMTFRPSDCANRQNSATSASPEKLNRPGSGSWTFQNR
jgi:hypothetical protein